MVTVLALARHVTAVSCHKDLNICGRFSVLWCFDGNCKWYPVFLSVSCMLMPNPIKNSWLLPSGWCSVTWYDMIEPKNVFWWCQNSTRARSVCPRVDKNDFPKLKSCFVSKLFFFDSLGSEKGRTGRQSPPVTCTKDVPGSAKPGSPLRWPWAHAPAEQTQPHCWAHTHVQAQPNPIICLALSFSFSRFISVARIQPPSLSTYELRCQAGQGWQAHHCGFPLFYISPVWTFPCLSALFLSPLLIFSSPKRMAWQSVSILFNRGTTKVNTEGLCATRSRPGRHWKRAKNIFVRAVQPMCT